MKNTALILAFVAMSVALYATHPASSYLSGETSTNFGAYQLTPSENCTVINDVAYKTWNLSYSNTGENFQVLVSSGVDGHCCLIIRNNRFEIQYASKDGVFGAALLEAPHRQLKKNDVMKQMNWDNFRSQEILTTGNKTEQEYLGLAACFLPLLMN